MKVQKFSLLQAALGIMLLSASTFLQAYSASVPKVNPIFTGSQYLVDQVCQTLVINGSVYDQVNLVRCTIEKTLSISTGTAQLQNCFFGGGTIKSDKKITITSSTVNGTFLVDGSLEAFSTEFNGNVTLLENASFRDSRLRSITMPQGLNAEYTIHLYGNTVVSGFVDFQSGKGRVVLHDNARVVGRVFGGSIELAPGTVHPDQLKPQSTTSNTVTENTHNNLLDAVVVGFLYYVFAQLFGEDKQIIRNVPDGIVVLANETCDFLDAKGKEVKIDHCTVREVRVKAPKGTLTNCFLVDGVVAIDNMALEDTTISGCFEVQGAVSAVRTTVTGVISVSENAHFYDSRIETIVVPIDLNAQYTIHLYGNTTVRNVKFLNLRGGTVVLHNGAKVLGGVAGGTVRYSNE